MNDSFQSQCREILQRHLGDSGECHSIDHTLRVRDLSLFIAQFYPEVNRRLLEAAAYFHDIGRGIQDASGKSHGKISGELADPYLRDMNFSYEEREIVVTAIEEHPFSGGAIPSHIVGKILQDADRLDALGAIGIVRACSYSTDRPLYNLEDPFGLHRPLDDNEFTLDHFYLKLFKLPDMLHTPEAKKVAEKRVLFMKQFLEEFASELSVGNVRLPDHC